MVKNLFCYSIELTPVLWTGDKNKVTDVNDDTNDEDDDEVSGDIHLIYRQEVSSWLSTATKDQLKPAPLAWTIYT